MSAHNKVACQSLLIHKRNYDLVNCWHWFLVNFFRIALLTVVHSPILTMVGWILPREQRWTKWPLIDVTIDMYWLETWHVPARKMECGLELNLSVVSLSSITASISLYIATLV